LYVIGVHLAYNEILSVIGVEKLNSLLNVSLSVNQPLNVYHIFVGSAGLVPVNQYCFVCVGGTGNPQLV
jgi:hypothetical protein